MPVVAGLLVIRNIDYVHIYTGNRHPFIKRLFFLYHYECLSLLGCWAVLVAGLLAIGNIEYVHIYIGHRYRAIKRSFGFKLMAFVVAGLLGGPRSGVVDHRGTYHMCIFT